MISNAFSSLGPWSWIVLGLVLLTLEILAPGVYLLWIGAAAIIVGALSLVLWDLAFWSWQLQAILFALLAIACTYVGRQYFTSREQPSDQPLLNRRSEQMIGRTATLSEPIVNGRGRIKLGDTLWRVKGADLPVGAVVRVTGVSEMDLELVVEKI